ncbi:MAG: hypothetical protein AAFV29_09260 [Myxococcota bacterium]
MQADGLPRKMFEMPRLCIWAFAGLFLLSGCETDCPQFNVLRAVMDPPRSSPPDDTPWIGGARGDIRYDIEDEPPADFDPLIDALLTDTATQAVVRWTAFTRDERMVLIEIPVPDTPGEIIPIRGVTDDVEFTGGYQTFGWWQSRWRLNASTATVGKANLILAFSRDLTMQVAEGTAEVIDVDPLELQLDVLFIDDEDQAIRIFSDVRFERLNRVEICSP